MTGRSVGPRNDPDRILIAIDAHFDDMQEIAAAFAFLPEPLPAARIEMDGAAVTAPVQRFGIHMPYHEDGTVGDIRHDGCQQAVPIKFQIDFRAGFAILIHDQRLTEASAPRNRRLKAIYPPRGEDKPIYPPYMPATEAGGFEKS